MTDLRFADCGLAVGRAMAEHHHSLESAVRATGMSPNHPTITDHIRKQCRDHTESLRDIITSLHPDMTEEQWEWVEAAARRGQRIRMRELTSA